MLNKSRVLYCYLHHPNHFDTAILNIDYANEKLKGRYWTDRGTKGTLNFSKDAK